MRVNASVPVGCNETCIHPNKRYSFVFVGKNKNFMEAKRYCEDLNGTLANHLYKSAYQTIQSCCKSVYKFRIGLIQDEVCADYSTHPFRWVSQINKCRKAKDLNVINKTLLGNSSCKTVSIATTSSQTEIPHATLDDCDKEQYFICRKKLSISYPETSTTTVITATSKTKTSYPETSITTGNTATSKQETFYPKISTTTVITATPKTETSYPETSITTGNTATSIKETYPKIFATTGITATSERENFTSGHTPLDNTASPVIVGGVTLASVMLISLLVFLVYRRRKKSPSKRMPTKTLNNNEIVGEDHSKHCHNIIREGDDNSTQSISPVYLSAPSANYINFCQDDVNKTEEKSGIETENEYIGVEHINRQKKKGEPAVSLSSDYTNVFHDKADKRDENKTECGYVCMKNISDEQKQGEQATWISSDYAYICHDEADKSKENEMEDSYVCTENIDHREKKRHQVANCSSFDHANNNVPGKTHEILKNRNKTNQVNEEGADENLKSEIKNDYVEEAKTNEVASLPSGISDDSDANAVVCL